MADKPLIIIENKIPFIKGLLEPFANVRYLSPEEFRNENIKDADALIVRTRTLCNESLLVNTSVKFIATATIGTDHIDTNWCKQNGITVANAPGCNAPAVAQYVWSSILNLDIKPENATIGVIGCGNVGSIVIEWGELLGAKMLRCDPPLSLTDKTNLYLSLEELLPKCDVVTIHTPLSIDGDYPTFHMIGEKELHLMKKEAVLINAARGAVISTADIIKVAKNSSIRTVIDCWEGEPNISEELFNLSSIATPHIAGYSLEGKQRATRMIVEATAHFFEFQLSKINFDGLAEAYKPKKEINAEKILSSYSPLTDTLHLQQSFDNIDREDVGTDISTEKARLFEQLRASYTYRREP